jgi:hypothetical protein
MSKQGPCLLLNLCIYILLLLQAEMSVREGDGGSTSSSPARSREGTITGTGDQAAGGGEDGGSTGGNTLPLSVESLEQHMKSYLSLVKNCDYKNVHRNVNVNAGSTYDMIRSIRVGMLEAPGL